MNSKKPINVFNGLKSKITNLPQVQPISNLIAIKAYQNSKNITKTFTKPISKII